MYDFYKLVVFVLSACFFFCIVDKHSFHDSVTMADFLDSEAEESEVCCKVLFIQEL